MLHEQMISIPTLAPMEELDVLMQFIRANPVQLDRYRHLRSISPNKDSKSALCGLHRNMWKDMTLSFRDQKMMMSYIEELPDHTPNVAAIREYAEKFSMPNEDANFLRACSHAQGRNQFRSRKQEFRLVLGQHTLGSLIMRLIEGLRLSGGFEGV
jgi:hypothetical protein